MRKNPLLHLFIGLTGALAALAPATSFAQDANPQPSKSRFEILQSKKDGESPVRMVFKDGREASLLVARSGMRYGSLRMKLTETLCGHEDAKANCSMILPLEDFHGRMIWMKHPDQSKIGQDVKLRYAAGSVQNLVSDATVSFSLSIEDRQRMGKKVVPGDGQFVCDDYGWMNINDEGGVARWVSIKSWGAEFNSTNTETNLNENLTFNGAFDLQLSPIFGRAFKIDSGTFYSSFALPALISTGPATLVIRNKEGELCQSSFSVDFQKVQKLMQELQIVTKKSEYLPLQIPQDILVRFLPSIEQIRQKLDQGDANYGVPE